MSFLDPESRQQLKVASRVGAVGLELVLATAFGWFGGRYLDGQLDTTPYLAYLGVFCGILAGFRGVAHVARRHDLDAM